MKVTLLLTVICLFAACNSKKQPVETQNESQATSAQESKSCCPGCVEIPVKKETPAPEKESCCDDEAAPQAGKASDESIYQLSSTWLDANNQTRTLKSLGGRLQVITMGYSTCKYACPRLLADMRIIEAGLPKNIQADTHFTFFSIDPKIDTPERLTEYRKENKIPSTRWTLLTSDETTVQELAVVLGLKYRRTGETDFAHSNLIIVLNKKGEIIHRQEGLAADPATTIEAIKNAQSSPASIK